MMGNKMISITLLLFELSVILASTVAPNEESTNKIETANDKVIAHNAEPKNTTYVSDVYEVQEFGEKSIAFVSPQPKKPTLREIIYYHMVERPYGKTDMDKLKPLEINFDDTIRPFTNSHGYQYRTVHRADPPVEVTTSATTSKHEETTVAPPAIRDEAKDQKVQQARERLLSKLKERITKLKNSKHDDPLVEETTSATTSKHEETTVAPPAIRDEAKGLKVQQAREALLTKLNERRNKLKNNKHNTTSAKERPKRQLNEIPEAPRLEEIDLPQLGYMFATVSPLMDQNDDPYAVYSYPANDQKSDIKDKVDGIFVTLKPFDETTPNNDKDVVGYLVENKRNIPESHHTGYDENGNKVVFVIDHENSEDGRPDSIMTVTERAKIEPSSMTYGMNLSLGRGYVWNKLVEPTVLYAVESPEYDVGPTVSTLDLENSNAASPTIEIDIDKQQLHVTTTKPTDHEDYDIYVNIEKRPKPNATISKNEEKPQTSKMINSDNEEHKIDDKQNKVNEKHNNPDKNRDRDNSDDNDHDSKKKTETHSKNDTKLQQPKKHKDEKPDLYQQLINSDKFWQWLAHWTSSYTQHLTKTVKDMVKEEVKRQLKDHKPKLEEPKINKTKDEETKPVTPVIDDKKNVDDKKDEKKPLDDKSNTKDNESDIGKNSDQSHKNDTKLQELKSNDTKTSNKEKTEDKPQNPEKIVTGNEKTTNIFIFFPNDSTSDIIKSILGNNNVVVKPTEEKQHNNKPKNEITPQNEEQKNKDESLKKPDHPLDKTNKEKPKNEKLNDNNPKDENSGHDKPKDTTLKDETPKFEKPGGEKPKDVKPKDEKSVDNKPIEETPKDKNPNEKPEEKKPDEPEEPKPNPPATPEKKDPTPT